MATWSRREPGEGALRILLITRTLVPGSCGIGDYSLELSRHLTEAGHSVVLVGGRVSSLPLVQGIGDEWDRNALARALERIEAFAPDRVLLQYTPQMYPERRGAPELLASFWRTCCERWCSGLVLHETYYRELRHPPSWIRGAKQKRRIDGLVRCSRFVFTASEPLVRELRAWNSGAEISYLPVGSAFRVIPADRASWRAGNGISPDDVVVTLFGGGVSLKRMRTHVDAVDARLRGAEFGVHWVLLGGVPPEWFHVASPVHVPGRLSDDDVSRWLQASDVFLMPHDAGVCGKRSTLMAAMQHALPVVGIRGPMTDSFWDDEAGVTIVPRRPRSALADAVVRLAREPTLRKAHGIANRASFDQHFSWARIVDGILAGSP